MEFRGVGGELQFGGYNLPPPLVEISTMMRSVGPGTPEYDSPDHEAAKCDIAFTTLFTHYLH